MSKPTAYVLGTGGAEIAKHRRMAAGAENVEFVQGDVRTPAVVGAWGTRP